MLLCAGERWSKAPRVAPSPQGKSLGREALGSRRCWHCHSAPGLASATGLSRGGDPAHKSPCNECSWRHGVVPGAKQLH